MNWTEVEEGHWATDSGLHIVNGDLCDPCQPCKGTGRRGRGRCGACHGSGNRRRRFNIPSPVDGFLVQVMPWQCGFEKAKALQERDQDPRYYVEFSPEHNGKWDGVLHPYE